MSSEVVSSGPICSNSGIVKRLLVFVFLLVAVLARADQTDPKIVVGKARFTVVAPECIRIEYAKDGKFVDAKSMFAVGRDAVWRGFQVEPRRQQRDHRHRKDPTAIPTPTIRPFNQGNLRAQIARGAEWVDWWPGLRNQQNLGGTIRTLDGVKGPVDLGDGVLARDGWYLLDDSSTHLLTDDWVEERPDNGNTDWYLFGYGTDYKAGLKALTRIGGAVPLPRKYVLGAWYSRYWPYSSKDYHEIVEGYAQHDFPLDVIVMDMDWHKSGWTGWSWNRELVARRRGVVAMVSPARAARYLECASGRWCRPAGGHV